MKTFKKIADIVIGIIIAIILLASILVIIANASRGKDDVPQIFGYTFASVQSDSMTGTFEEGDIVVGRIVDENTVIKENEDIISFYEVKNGYKIINTHRVVRIEKVGDVTWYYTQGDKDGLPEDFQPKSHDQVIAVYQFKLAGFGKFVDFLREPIGFILVVVLPILLVIGWEAYKLIALYMEHKKAQYLEESQSAVAPSEEMKEQIIQEYLKSLNSGNNADVADENKIENNDKKEE